MHFRLFSWFRFVQFRIEPFFFPRRTCLRAQVYLLQYLQERLGFVKLGNAFSYLSILIT